jgi:sRNA-binding regulator protein Hfq
MKKMNFRVGELVTLVLLNGPFNVSGIVWKFDGETVWLERDRHNQKISVYEIVDIIRNNY